MTAFVANNWLGSVVTIFLHSGVVMSFCVSFGSSDMMAN